MADFNSKGERIVSVVRVLEYRGTEKWIKAVMEASRLPVRGLFDRSFDGKPLPEGCSIRSGLVVWMDEEAEASIAGGGSPNPSVIPIPPGSQVI